jgi:hypothetical protein
MRARQRLDGCLAPRMAGLAAIAAIAAALATPEGAAGAQVSATPARRIVIAIGARTLTLELARGREVFPVSLGAESARGPKERRGDRRTPRGTYFVSALRPRHPRFHRFALLAYPGPGDAAHGLRRDLIDEPIATRIREAFEARRTPPQDTPLGGQIGIHGLGAWSVGEELVGRADLTDGCIAMRDGDIDRLWPHLRRGTEVRIAE